MKPRVIYAACAAALFGIEVLIATVFKHWTFVRGSLGDVFVTGLLYCMVLAFRDVNRLVLAALVFGFACLVESAQYLHLAQLLGLAQGSALRIAIGESFNWGDIVCYFIGCVVALGLDTTWRQESRA